MLDLASCCQETALVWPAVPTWEDWAELGPRLARVSNASRWALADWLVTGDEMFSDRADQIVSQLGLAFHTVENLRWVASRVPRDVRRPLPVSFSHHALVAAFDPMIQDRELAYCQEKGYTREEFRAHLADEGLVAPRFSLRGEWNREAARALEHVLSRWFEQSDLFAHLPEARPDERWFREREALVQQLLGVLERFRA